MKYLSLLVLVSGISVSSQAKVWRLNNNNGVTADFTSVSAAISSSAVGNGDTLYLEPSATVYAASTILTKSLVFIGAGYYLDPAHSTTPGNGGLQVATQEASMGYLYVPAAASNSKFLGLAVDGLYFRGASDVTIERVRFFGPLQFDQGVNTRVTARKCFFSGALIGYTGGATASNFVCENNILSGGNAVMYLNCLTGSENVIRNNTFYNTSSAGSMTNAYFVNNIVDGVAFTFTNCTIKNNVFKANQSLPVTATDNKISVVMADVFVGTGSVDGKMMLRSASPAKGAGLTVGTVISPDCGAFGATNPYVLSGIPPVPSIYTFTAPTSIPSGSATMNITFSTRNNN